MIRRTIAIILLFSSISIIILVPILTFTPVGKRLFDGSTQASSIPTPTFIPVTPTLTLKPTPIFTARGNRRRLPLARLFHTNLRSNR